MRTAPIVRLFVLMACATVIPVAAQPEVLLEKRTNGQDADAPPGPAILVGSPVNWTYVVTNSGSRPLMNIVVTDDQGVVVTCPGTTLAAGFDMTCTANGVAVAGQYANVGTVDAELPDGTPVSDSDPSHYFGQAAASITIEKSTEGVDADSPPGPSLAVGAPVSWTYEVTNVGSDPLDGITVSDDQGVAVSCPFSALDPGESMTCTASDTVQPGQYANLGTVIAQIVDTPDMTSASDPSHYFGQTLLLEKSTNGQDADLPPGPTLMPGAAVSWTYQVTNPGPATVTNLGVTDDQGVVVTCPQTMLAAGEFIICTGNGTAQAGQYANVGTATAELPGGGTVTATDPSHYFGNLIDIQKSTNGQDADLPPGPVVAVGAAIAWTYEVTNLGPDPLTNVVVTDSQGVMVTCPMAMLAAGESMTCTAGGVAVAGQYSNEGLVTADLPSMAAVSASDFSHYFGQDEIVDFGDAPDPSFFTLLGSNAARHLLGSSVYLGACVDSELDGQPTASADGDDLGAGIQTFGTCAVPGDDEDGVVFTSQLIAGTMAGVDVTANDDCTLAAWIDFNRDGDWTDASEDLFPGGALLTAGTTSLLIAVPPSAVAGSAAARFRCNSDSAVSFTGAAGDGEVEDYLVTLFASPASVSAAKTVALLADGDGDGIVDAGDTLLYTVLVTNSGGADALGVVFTDAPDANTTLVNGSVTTTAGTVVLGNTGGDASVQVDVGDIPGGGSSVTITFQVTANDPLPTGTTDISNQGLVAGDNFTDVPTDDPGLPGTTDPTVIPAGASPAAVSATKTVVLLVDPDGGGMVTPGDTLGYSVVLTNAAAVDATSVVFTDTPDANTTLVNGSVTTTAGTVVLGNGGGDASIQVDVGTLAAGGGTVTITFQVTVNDPLAPGTTEISNQGLATGDNFPDAATDDPTPPGAADPTVIAVETPVIDEIPTAETWSLLALVLLLAGVAVARLGRA